MDQLNQVLAAIKKYHFWILSGLVIVQALAIYHVGTGPLAANVYKQKTEITQDYKSVEQVVKEPNPPNQKTVELIAEQQKKLAAEVFGAWKFLYDEQSRRNKWPDALGVEFLARIRGLKPYELIEDEDRETYQYFIRKHVPRLFLPPPVGVGVDVRMTPEERKWYEDRIAGRPVSKELPKKKPDQQADAAEAASKSEPAKAAAPPKPALPEEITGIVDWDIAGRQELEARFDWRTPPTSSQIWLAQEDLWVYEALLRIIHSTNKTATSQYNAPVKRILRLAIGQDAGLLFANTADRIFRGYAATFGSGLGFGGPGMYPMGPGSATGLMPSTIPGAGYPSSMPGAAGGAMPMGPSSASLATPSSMPSAAEDSGDDAYSEDGGLLRPGAMSAPGVPAGMPLMPSMPGGMPGMPGMSGAPYGMSSAAGGISEDEQMRRLLTHGRYVDQNGFPLAYDAKPPFAEFKMMPVYMLLGVDQEAIPVLLTECANSSMPVVVRRLSLRPGESGQYGVPGSESPEGGLAGMSGLRPGFGAGPSTMPTPSMPTPSMPGGIAGGSSRPTYRPSGTSSSEGYGTSFTELEGEMVIEIQGIIYIFNPPDKKALGTGAATEVAPAEAPEGGQEAGQSDTGPAGGSGGALAPPPATPASPPAGAGAP